MRFAKLTRPVIGIKFSEKVINKKASDMLATGEIRVRLEELKKPVNRIAKGLVDNIKIISRLEQLKKPVIEKAQLTLERVILENMNYIYQQPPRCETRLIP